MTSEAVTLDPVESASQREVARELIAEYLRWVGEIARSQYGLSFDIDAMIQSDIEDESKFYPPSGRFYLVKTDGAYVGVGCLQRLGPGVGEIQRMYVQPHVRGKGAGRLLVERLLADAGELGYTSVRLESLKALTAAHTLYHSVGFVDIPPYDDDSMKDYQDPATRERFLDSTLFMQYTFPDKKSSRSLKI
jgi:GNAT superfamily N-acetyltransferase